MRESQLQKTESEKPVVHHVVGTGEVVCHQDILLRRGALRRVAPSCLRSLPAILHLLDESPEVVLDRAASSEADLLWGDEPSGL